MRLRSGEIEFAPKSFISLRDAGVLPSGEASYVLDVYMPHAASGRAVVPASALEALAALAVQAMAEKPEFRTRLIAFLKQEGGR